MDRMDLIKNTSPNAENECIDHPLGILCRCEEYKKIVNKFVCNTVGTLNTGPKNSYRIDFEEPIASAKVRWFLQKAEKNKNPTKPVLYNATEKPENVSETNVEKAWIPVNTNLVSAKQLRPNTSYRHRTFQNTQSADISVLTDMLPHRGRTVKRKDIDWEIGSHTTPVQMTDDPETKFYSVKGCFSTWAQSYTLATGLPAY